MIKCQLNFSRLFPRWFKYAEILFFYIITWDLSMSWLCVWVIMTQENDAQGSVRKLHMGHKSRAKSKPKGCVWFSEELQLQLIKGYLYRRKVVALLCGISQNKKNKKPQKTTMDDNEISALSSPLNQSHPVKKKNNLWLILWGCWSNRGLVL